MTDLIALGVGAAGDLLARGEISAAALTRAYLERIAAVEPALHCYVSLRAEDAVAEGHASDARRRRGESRGPLDGIPLALKDNIDLAGLPTTHGMGPRGDAVPARDAEVTRRLREAGAVVLGKLNMHEGALGATTDNPHCGRTDNPWRSGFTPGGSSGGTGAAVAARLCAAGLGTDTMGSVRLPAALCGVVGLKPTFGLVSARGVAPLSPRLDTVGPLARSAADAALLLDAMAGFDPEHPGSAEHPGAPLGHLPDREGLAGVTIAIAEELDRIEVDADVRRAFEQSVAGLERLGASVIRVELGGYEAAVARRAGFLVSEADGAVIHEQDLAAWPGAFSPEFRRMLEYGRDASAARLVKAERLIERAGFLLRRALRRADLIACPTAPRPAFPFGAPAPVDLADLTAIANFGGCPAISLPCGLASSGLPVGLQLIGPPFGERALLAVARAFEIARGAAPTPPEWFDRAHPHP